MRDRRRTRIILALLLLTSFTLITLDYRAKAGSPLAPLRRAVSAVVGPVERAAAAIVRPVRGFVDDIGTLGDSKRQIADLERENARLRAELGRADLDTARIAEQEKLLRLAGAGQYRIVPARVVAYGDRLGFEFTITIDAGSRDGVKEGLTVVNGDGLVGRVKAVGRDTATVLLAIDAISGVAARVEGSLEFGTVTGQGRRDLAFELLDANARISVGQRLVTFGSRAGGPFVAEVPIGVISEVARTPGALTRSAKVTPFVNFSALDLIGVVLEAPRTIARDSVLPPKPTPSPTPTPSLAPSPAASGSPQPTATASPNVTRRP